MVDLIITVIEGINWESALARFLVMLTVGVFLGALVASSAFRWICLAVFVWAFFAIDDSKDEKAKKQ